MDPGLPLRTSARQFLLGRENYERWRTMPYDQVRMGLDRMRRLLAELGSPEREVPVVHVAGTKGKGSTSAMLAAALTAAGYRTGLFTSPHLERVEERIQVDGQCISPEDFDALLEAVRPAVERLDRQEAGPFDSIPPAPGSVLPAPGSVPILSPTFFEIVTAMAFVHFARQKVQAAVMEVGLGGRLDSTNVCQPVVSIITSISYDHTQQLGATLTAIAGEKAGIIRPGVPVVSGVIEPEPRDVIRRVCRERGAPLVERGADFDFTYEPPRHLERDAATGRLTFRRVGQASPASAGPPIPLSLPGRHQAANAATVLATIDVLRKIGWEIPDAAVSAALADLQWPARVEVVARRPVVVVDAAHNVASIEALMETLRESFSVARRLLVFGTTQDKDVRGMLAVLLGSTLTPSPSPGGRGEQSALTLDPLPNWRGGFDEVFFTRYQGSSRAVPPEELQRLGEELTGRRWPVFDESSAAWRAARAAAGDDDLICITGSFFLAAEMKARSL